MSDSLRQLDAILMGLKLGTCNPADMQIMERSLRLAIIRLRWVAKGHEKKKDHLQCEVCKTLESIDRLLLGEAE